jgi:hypothetical protein
MKQEAKVFFILGLVNCGVVLLGLVEKSNHGIKYQLLPLKTPILQHKTIMIYCRMIN